MVTRRMMNISRPCLSYQKQDKQKAKATTPVFGEKEILNSATVQDKTFIYSPSRFFFFFFFFPLPGGRGVDASLISSV